MAACPCCRKIFKAHEADSLLLSAGMDPRQLQLERNQRKRRAPAWRVDSGLGKRLGNGGGYRVRPLQRLLLQLLAAASTAAVGSRAQLCRARLVLSEPTQRWLMISRCAAG